MTPIKTLISAIVLSSVAAVSFAQTPAAVKAPAATATPAVTTTTTAAAPAPTTATPAVAKKPQVKKHRAKKAAKSAPTTPAGK
jgi:hypothetical protein